MTLKSYYRSALGLPLAVPLFSLPLTLLEGTALRGIMLVPVLLFYSVVFGGLPYLLFAGAFQWWMTGKDADEVRRAVLRAPMYFAAVMGACVAAFIAAVHPADLLTGEVLSPMVMLGGTGFFFGYGYVALAEAGRVALQRRGLLAAGEG